MFKDMLSIAVRKLVTLPEFKVWHTLTIGGAPTARLLERLENIDCDVSGCVKYIMGKSQFTTAPEPQEVPLVRVKVGDLGFTEMPTTAEFFTRAKERGLDLCPAEVGPHLCLALTGQSKNDWFLVAMEPIIDSFSHPRVFFIYRHANGWRWLHASCADPDLCWDLECEFVFCLSKPA